MDGQQLPSNRTRTRGKARGFTETQLREFAARGATELQDAGAAELLRRTDETFGPDGYVVTSNMQDAVLVDLAAKVRPGV